MIIDMTEVIGKYLSNKYTNDINEQIENIINEILTYNSHFIKVKPIDYYNLSERSEFSKKTRQIFAEMYEKYSTKTSIMKKINTKVIVTENGTKNKIIKESGVFKLTISQLNSYCLSENVILGENIIDCNIYVELTELYIKKNYNNVGLKLMKLNGGGSTIGKTYQSLCQQNKIVLSIVDSDKKYPEDNLGGTADTIKNIDEILSNLGEVSILNVRELENLIPIKIFEMLFKHSKGTIFNTFKHIENFKEFYNFIDLKIGLKIKDLKDKKFLETWGTILKELNFHEISKNIKYAYSPSDRKNFEKFFKFINLRSKLKIKDLQNKKFLETWEQFLKESNFHEISKDNKCEYNSLEKLIESLNDLNENSCICTGYKTEILNTFFKYLKNVQLIEIEKDIEKFQKLKIENVAYKINNLKNKKQNLKDSYSNLLNDIEINEISEKILTWGCYYNGGIKANSII